ncbi:MAG: 23S rRNA (guanosine(2251)-2'-O)-methyltransferase RlmB [Candidatus Limnocylindrales bacterium]
MGSAGGASRSKSVADQPRGKRPRRDGRDRGRPADDRPARPQDGGPGRPGARRPSWQERLGGPAPRRSEGPPERSGPPERPYRPPDRAYRPPERPYRPPYDGPRPPDRAYRPPDRPVRPADRPYRPSERPSRPSDRPYRGPYDRPRPTGPPERAGDARARTERPREEGPWRPQPPVRQGGPSGAFRAPPRHGPRRFDPRPYPTSRAPQPAGFVGGDDELVAGRRPVEEAFAAGREARRLLIVPQRRAPLEALVLHATTLRIPVVEIEGGTLTSLAGFDGHQGVALVVAPRRWATLEDVLARAEESAETPFVLVLDSLEDPHNLGSLLRTAEAAGVHGVVFPTHHAAPLSPSAVKASAGAVEHLLLVPADDLPSTLVDLHLHGLRLVGAEAGAALAYRDADLRGPLALVVGSEGRGVSGAVRRRLDLAVRIPMRGKVGSLNAAVAGSILLLEAAMQRTAGIAPSETLPAGAATPADAGTPREEGLAGAGPAVPEAPLTEEWPNPRARKTATQPRQAKEPRQAKVASSANELPKAKAPGKATAPPKAKAQSAAPQPVPSGSAPASRKPRTSRPVETPPADAADAADELLPGADA